MYVRGKVEPNAAEAKITRFFKGLVIAFVTAPSVEGKANDEVCARIAEVLRLPKSRVALTEKATSPVKTVEASGIEGMVVLRRFGSLDL
ncbi:MAG: DUF167 domain-containing protein [bacterium JZ-2024 1]